MDGKDFLELAKRLQNSDDEASRRTSVSRSYYAIFNLIKDFLSSNGVKLPKAAQAHEKAHQYLYNSGVVEAEDLAGDLNNLRDKRNDADYELRIPKYRYDKKNCEFVCVKANQFFEQFDKINPDQLLKGISEYKKKINE